MRSSSVELSSIPSPKRSNIGGLACNRGVRTGMGRLRTGARALALLALITLAGCGGGYDSSGVPFQIGVTIGGQVVSQTTVVPGGSMDVSIRAGQSVDFDAGEPAVWRMYLGGTSFPGGSRVLYAGADIATTVLGPSALGVDTAVNSFMGVAIPVTLVATSTYDAAQVATVHLLITP